MTTDYEEYLRDWILNFLSIPNELFNNLPPCPFARKSLVDNKIRFIKGDNYVEEISKLLDVWDAQFDVVVYVAPNDVNKDTFVEDVKFLNDVYIRRGFVCLEDHKDIPENFFNLKFNNGKYNIILCQQIDKINQASVALLKQGYYKNWSHELYDDVVSWRFLPTIS